MMLTGEAHYIEWIVADYGLVLPYDGVDLGQLWFM